MIWFQNVLHVEGAPTAVTEFMQRGRKVERSRGEVPREYALSFSSFVPRPADLDVHESAIGLEGYAALFGDFTTLLNNPRIQAVGAKTREAVVAYLDWINPEYRRLGERYESNERLYGHRTWLSWNRVHYGPKWDLDTTTVVRRKSLTEAVYCFRTHEEQPWPWLKAVMKLCPELKFDLRLSAAAPRLYLKAV